MTQSRLHSVASAAEALRLSPRSVQRRIKDGRIVATKLSDGKTSPYVITAEELERIKQESSA